MGTEKKKYAVQYLQDSLRKQGLNKLADDLPYLEGVIEAQVRQGVHKRSKVLLE